MIQTGKHHTADFVSSSRGVHATTPEILADSYSVLMASDVSAHVLPETSEDFDVDELVKTKLTF